MILLELHIRPAPIPLRPPEAWFIPGDDAAIWLDEMTAWNIPLADGLIYVLPKSISDLRPAGAMVVLPAHTPQSTSCRAIPYGRQGQRLYVPIDAELRPVVCDAELDRALIWPVEVFHPTCGLCGFKPDDALRIHELLDVPAPRAIAWDRAVAGAYLNETLRSVELEQPPTVDEIFEQARDDIGSSDPDLLPPQPDESALKDVVSRIKMPFMRAANWLARRAPGGAGGKLGKWASENLAHLSAHLQELRDRELHRLLKMLQNDPDQGLQYAIPLRDLSTRGRAAPSGNLSKRTPWFDLGRFLGGASPGDSWFIGFDLQQRLQERYRAAANRELNLGRFRRAAYIFAELLGDVSSAASALKQGRHFREAAALYVKRLNSPRLAAECLEAGGLLIEAVPLYEQIGDFVKAGDLYAKLEQPQEAERLYRMAVQQNLDRSDVVTAAKLLETKLNAPHEALDILEDAWPLAAQAPTCLAAWFALAGRCGLHDRALRRAREIRSNSPPEHRVLAAVQTLAELANQYPDANVRAASADIARVVAGQHLARTYDLAQQRGLVNAVAAIDPGDKLLARDTARFLTTIQRKRIAPTPIPLKGGGAKLLRTFSFQPRGLRWCAFASTSDGFFAIGAAEKTTVIARGDWSDLVMVRTFETPQTAQPEFVLVPLPAEMSLLVLPLATPRAHWRLRHPMIMPGKGNALPFQISTPDFLRSEPVVGACLDDHGTLWTADGVTPDDITLRSHEIRTGNLLATHALRVADTGAQTINRPVPLIVRRGWIYAAWQNQLTIINPAGVAMNHEMPRPIRSLLASAPHTLTRIVATFDEGAATIQPTGEYHLIADGLFDAVAAFTSTGVLVVVSAGRGHLYDTRGGQATFRASFDDTGQAPVGVVPAGADQFGILNAEGEVRLFSIAQG